MPGFWVSFDIDGDKYWLMLERDRLTGLNRVRWVGWASVVAAASLLGAALISSLVNLPLARLSAAARAMAQGKPPTPLPEKGPQEVAEANRSFNQMVEDLQQLEQDRAVILAGISGVVGGASILSVGSSVRMRMPSFETSSNRSSRRSSGAEWVNAALVMVTTETRSSAVCSTCGPRWKRLMMPIQQAIDSVVSTDSSRKVRQNRPLLAQASRRDGRRAPEFVANTSEAVLQG
jgi:HAMP domain-containing protein